MTRLSSKQLIAAALAGLALGVGIVPGHTLLTRGAGTLPFGGPILESHPCECTDNWWFKVGAPVPADVVYQPGISTLYEYRQIYRVGPNVLGTYLPGGSCKYGSDCDDEHVDGTVVIAGTSQ